MSAQEITTLKSKVKVTADKTSSIQSDFTQYKHMEFLTNDIETQGKMLFKAPRLVKWQYTTPFKYSVIFKQDQILIDDGGNKSQVDIGSHKLFKELNGLIISSVKGDMFNEERFEMSYKQNTKEYVVTFIPKDKKIREYIGSFVLNFEKTTALVQSVKMVEPTGDYTLIVFKNRVLNSPLSDAEFSN
jgi:outer membrane lipoprotein carrier protein